MMLVEMTLTVFVVVALILFVGGLSWEVRRSSPEKLRRRLEALGTAAPRNEAEQEQVRLLRDELMSEIPPLQQLLTKLPSAQRLKRWLGQADVKMRPGKFVMVTAATGAVGQLGAEVLNAGWLSLATGGAMALLPAGWVAWRRRRRLRKFEEQLPLALELIVRSLRAGHTLSSSLELVATELPQPIAGEFRILFDEERYGLPLRDALWNMVDRVPLLDVRFFVTSVLIQRETGGNLAEILENLATVVRGRFALLRQVRTHTAQGRLTMVILMMLPPGMAGVLMLSDPQFMRPLFTDPIGHMLLMTGAVLQLIGYLLLRRIINIRV